MSRATAGRKQQLDTLANQRRRAAKADIAPVGTYVQYPVLVPLLPWLVEQQQEHAREVAKVKHDAEESERLKKQIADLLISAGVPEKGAVTVGDYTVTHLTREGQTKYHEDLIVPQLAVLELAPREIEDFLSATRTVGETSHYARIEVSKTAKARV